MYKIIACQLLFQPEFIERYMRLKPRGGKRFSKTRCRRTLCQLRKRSPVGACSISAMLVRVTLGRPNSAGRDRELGAVSVTTYKSIDTWY